MNHKVDALRRQTIQAHSGQVYKIIWQAHQKGEPWLHCAEIINRLQQQYQVALSQQNMTAMLRHLRETGYLRSAKDGLSNHKTRWSLHPRAIKLNKSEFGEPLSGVWSGCKTIQVDPRLAASSKAATASFTELEQYSKEAVK